MLKGSLIWKGAEAVLSWNEWATGAVHQPSNASMGLLGTALDGVLGWHNPLPPVLCALGPSELPFHGATPSDEGKERWKKVEGTPSGSSTLYGLFTVQIR